MIHDIPVTIIQSPRAQRQANKGLGMAHGKGNRCPLHSCMVDRLADGLYFCVQCGYEWVMVNGKMRPYDSAVKARGMQIWGP
jgi:hypothetical protein